MTRATPTPPHDTAGLQLRWDGTGDYLRFAVPAANRGVGGYERALEPFVRVGRVRSRLVRIEPDGLRARVYFDQPLPLEGALEFGYGDEVVYRVNEPFDAAAIARLDRRRLPASIRIAVAL